MFHVTVVEMVRAPADVSVVDQGDVIEVRVVAGRNQVTMRLDEHQLAELTARSVRVMDRRLIHRLRAVGATKAAPVQEAAR